MSSLREKRRNDSSVSGNLSEMWKAIVTEWMEGGENRDKIIKVCYLHVQVCQKKPIILYY